MEEETRKVCNIAVGVFHAQSNLTDLSLCDAVTGRMINVAQYSSYLHFDHIIEYKMC